MSSGRAFRPENEGTNSYLLTESWELQKWRIPFTDTFPSYWLKIFKLLCPSESRARLRVMSTVPKTKANTHDWEMLVPARVPCCEWERVVLALLHLKWLSAPCENSLQLNLCWYCYSQKNSMIHLVWLLRFELLIWRFFRLLVWGVQFAISCC